jgi:hypothetical protein
MNKQKRSGYKMTLQDIENLKAEIGYSPITGNFFRKLTTPSSPIKLCCTNKHATITLRKDGRKKHYTAWRVAVFFEKGFYPTFEDAIIFKDGDNTNFRINNLLVCHPSDDEQTILDFCAEYNLSPQTVNYRMKGAIRFERTTRNWRVYFYDKSELMRRCASLIKGGVSDNFDADDDRVQIKKTDLAEQQRGNKLAREFLKMWVSKETMPTRLEMTLI